ncbi:hypothetical protein K8U61_21545 [Nocardioides sp. GBK3QG-3]|uniref:Indole-3-glycerol-phosphate synthase TrpC n=1 Tax=Nocardioides mangrovi TaxID=2874580 RepID=A0ABS7UIB9_9ACTN|nr:hypothetical protein [Nocardioides mangrovi]
MVTTTELRSALIADLRTSADADRGLATELVSEPRASRGRGVALGVLREHSTPVDRATAIADSEVL